MTAKPIPEGYHTITPYMTVRDAARAIEFTNRHLVRLRKA